MNSDFLMLRVFSFMVRSVAINSIKLMESSPLSSCGSLYLYAIYSEVKPPIPTEEASEIQKESSMMKVLWSIQIPLNVAAWSRVHQSDRSSKSYRCRAVSPYFSALERRYCNRDRKYRPARIMNPTWFNFPMILSSSFALVLFPIAWMISPCPKFWTSLDWTILWNWLCQLSNLGCFSLSRACRLPTVFVSGRPSPS